MAKSKPERIVMKRIGILLALLLALTAALSACGTAPADDADTAPAGPVYLNMATGGPSGTYYGFSAAAMQVLNREFGDIFNISVESTNGAKANMQLIASGHDQLAIVQNDVMTYAYNGEAFFSEDGPIQNFYAVMTIYPEPVQIIANKDITKIEQLKGKRVCVGDKGSGGEYNATQILASYGIDVDSDLKKINKSFADATDSLKSGEIDAAVIVAGIPTSAVTELAYMHEFNILPVDEGHISLLQSVYPFYTVTTIPAGTYEGQDTDITTVSVMATYIASDSVPEDVVYNFVKGMFENKDAITALNPNGSFIDPETAVSGISVPIHPGAQRYFDEINAGK